MARLFIVILISVLSYSLESRALFGHQTTAGAIEILMANRVLQDVDADVKGMQALLKTGETPEHQGVWQSFLARFQRNKEANPIVKKYMDSYAELMRVSSQLEDLEFLLKNANHFTDKFNRLEKHLEDLRDDLNTIESALNERRTLAKTGKPSITMSALGVLFTKIGMGDSARQHDRDNRAAAFTEDIPMLREARDKVQAEIDVIEADQAAAKATIEDLKKLVDSKKSYLSRITATGQWLAGKAVGLVKWALRRPSPAEPVKKAELTTHDRQVISAEIKRLTEIKIKKRKAYDVALKALNEAYADKATFLLDKRSALVNMLNERCGKTAHDKCVKDAETFLEENVKTVAACDKITPYADLDEMMQCLLAYTAQKRCKRETLKDEKCRSTVMADLQKKIHIANSSSFAVCQNQQRNPLQSLAQCAVENAKVGQIAAQTF